MVASFEFPYDEQVNERYNMHSTQRDQRPTTNDNGCQHLFIKVEVDNEFRISNEIFGEFEEDLWIFGDDPLCPVPKLIYESWVGSHEYVRRLCTAHCFLLMHG
jgi:hypothetical protein